MIKSVNRNKEGIMCFDAAALIGDRHRKSGSLESLINALDL
jgi:hypothetical protein